MKTTLKTASAATPNTRRSSESDSRPRQSASSATAKSSPVTSNGRESDMSADLNDLGAEAQALQRLALFGRLLAVGIGTVTDHEAHHFPGLRGDAHAVAESTQALGDAHRGAQRLRSADAHGERTFAAEHDAVRESLLAERADERLRLLRRAHALDEHRVERHRPGLAYARRREARFLELTLDALDVGHGRERAELEREARVRSRRRGGRSVRACGRRLHGSGRP